MDSGSYGSISGSSSNSHWFGPFWNSWATGYPLPDPVPGQVSVRLTMESQLLFHWSRCFPSLAVDGSYNIVIIRISRLHALIVVRGPADGACHKSIRTTLGSRAVHAIADNSGSRRALPGQ
jgi:hypothetical protein